MANYRVSLKFVELSDPALDEFAANIVLCLTGNAAFPDLPVAPTALGALRTTFHNALIAAADGGTQLTAVKNEARLALETGLRKDAAYVQSIAGQNLPMLLTSGFKAMSTNRSSSPLEAPVILNVDNQSSSQLFVDLGNVANAAAYQLKLVTPQGVTAMTVESTRARKIAAAGLIPGTAYGVQARATAIGVSRRPSWPRELLDSWRYGENSKPESGSPVPALLLFSTAETDFENRVSCV